MHIQVRDRVATFHFETGKSKNIIHDVIVREIMQVLEYGFMQFVFDFSDVDINFNSIISGFVLTTCKKLVDCGAAVTLDNIKEQDLELLMLAGMEGFKGKIHYKVREK